MNLSHSSSICALFVAGAAVACSASGGPGTPTPSSATGGTSSATGGSGTPATGGVPAAGGTGGNPGGATGGTIATGGSPTAMGGASASGGSAGGAPGSGGGSGSGGRLEALYTISPCPGVTPSPGSASSFPPCAACKASHCVPTSTAPADIPPEGDCPDDGSGKPGKCVPDPITDSGGKYTHLPCVMSLLRVPGACVPSCFVPGEAAIYLHQDDCADGELCSPCNAPLTGESLNVCEPTRCAAN